MKPRLLLLSDLWGQQRSTWLSLYTDLLETSFDLQYYDCCVLAGLDMRDYTQEALHRQFVEGGIDRAVDVLLKKEIAPLQILAFSVGGTIAWKANLKGLPVQKLYAISATRLRYETKRPNSNICLYFGAEDLYRPDQTWLENMNLTYQIITQKGHSIYKEPAIAKMICTKISASV